MRVVSFLMNMAALAVVIVSAILFVNTLNAAAGRLLMLLQ